MLKIEVVLLYGLEHMPQIGVMVSIWIWLERILGNNHGLWGW